VNESMLIDPRTSHDELLTPDEIKRCEPVPIINRARLNRQSVNEYRGACPIHGGDNETALSVTRKRDGVWLWHCFACDKGGSVIDFVMQADDVDFKEAVSICREEIVDGDVHPPEPQTALIEEKNLTATPDDIAHAEAALESHPTVMKFLRERGISL
jgi:DNA primase